MTDLREKIARIISPHSFADPDRTDDRLSCLNKADAILAAIPSGSGWRVPDGWALVPIEPTEAMLNAVVPWEHEGRLPAGCRPFPSRAQEWAVMLAAAPTPTGEGRDDG
jgi:hypothetical protein